MDVSQSTILIVVIVCALAEAHSPPSTSNATLLSSPPSSIQDLTDHNWVLLAHQIGLAQNPRFPFGAAIVDARSNALLCVSSNQMQNGHPRWSKFTAHGEMVVMENCTELYVPDIEGDRHGNSLDWEHVTLYSNIEPCPMCSQAIIWRGVRRAVFGARASVLATERCWNQSKMTFQEVVDKSAHFAPFKYIRGPLEDIEETIVFSFPSLCT